MEGWHVTQIIVNRLGLSIVSCRRYRQIWWPLVSFGNPPLKSTVLWTRSMKLQQHELTRPLPEIFSDGLDQNRRCVAQSFPCNFERPTSVATFCRILFCIVRLRSQVVQSAVVGRNPMDGYAVYISLLVGFQLCATPRQIACPMYETNHWVRCDLKQSFITPSKMFSVIHYRPQFVEMESPNWQKGFQIFRPWQDLELPKCI